MEMSKYGRVAFYNGWTLERFLTFYSTIEERGLYIIKTQYCVCVYSDLEWAVT